MTRLVYGKFKQLAECTHCGWMQRDEEQPKVVCEECGEPTNLMVGRFRYKLIERRFCKNGRVCLGFEEKVDKGYYGVSKKELNLLGSIVDAMRGGATSMSLRDERAVLERVIASFRSPESTLLSEKERESVIKVLQGLRT